PMGGVSLAVPFVVNEVEINPAPTLSSISPDEAVQGGGAFTLTVTGTNFVPSPVDRWGGSARTSTYIADTELEAAILASDLNSFGVVDVTVFNPAPGGGESSAESFDILEAWTPAEISTQFWFDASDGSTITITSGAVSQWNDK